MAAAILSELGGDRFAASSAGTFVYGSQPIGRMAAFTLESVGIAKYNYIPHRSRPLTEKLMQAMCCSGISMMSFLRSPGRTMPI